MSKIKSLVRDCIPPLFIHWLHHLRDNGVCFEGDFSNWQEANLQCTGYDEKEILKKVLAATIKVKNGEAAFERDSVVFEKNEYVWPILTGLMWASARSGGKLNVLDFGGALGSSYFQNRKFLQSLSDVKWNVVEQSHYVDAGREQIQDEQLRFYKSIDECLVENEPNIILLSSVLQYVEIPINILNDLSKVGALCLIIDRTPFHGKDENKLIIQKIPASIYSAAYPMWVFSLSRFERILAKNWKMVASNLSPEGVVHTKSGTEISFQGMLLESRK